MPPKPHHLIERVEELEERVEAMAQALIAYKHVLQDHFQLEQARCGLCGSQIHYIDPYVSNDTVIIPDGVLHEQGV